MADDVFSGMEGGGEEITFDNISADTEPEGRDLGEDAPDEFLDKQEPAGSKIADEKEPEEDEKDKSQDDKDDRQDDKDSDKDPEKDDDEAEEDPSIEFGDKKYNLKDLMENKEGREQLQKLIKDGAMMRKDYSQKTAKHAEAVKRWEQKRNDEVNKFRNYLSETNRIFNGSPLTFVMNSFSKGQDGKPLPPNVVRDRVEKWTDKLAEQLEQGDKFDPQESMKQYELESRLDRIEREKQAERQRKEQERHAQEVEGYSKDIVKKVLENMPKDEDIRSFIDEIPGLKAKLVEDVIEDLNKDLENHSDPDFDSSIFLNTYDFKKTWNDKMASIRKAYEKGYDSYIQRKKESSKRKPTKGTAKRPSRSRNDEGAITFDRLMGDGLMR